MSVNILLLAVLVVLNIFNTILNLRRRDNSRETELKIQIISLLERLVLEKK